MSIEFKDMTNAQKRAFRLKEARKLGRHTRAEWLEMRAFFKNTCAKCYGKSGLVNVERDHVIPIYQGGSDGIDNIQPLCAKCNASKGPDNTDLRPDLANYLNVELPAKYIVKHGI